MRLFLSISLFLLLFEISAQPTFTLSSSICEQSSLTATSINGTLVVSGYTWTTNPAGPIISLPNNSVTNITFPSTGTFTIALATTSGTNSYSYSNSITVNPLPTILISVSNPTPICPPPTNIGGLGMSASGANTYTWAPSSYTGANVSIFPQPSTSTTYTIYGTDVNGCIGQITEFIPVHPIPSVFASGTPSVCVGDNICLNASGSLQIWFWSGPCAYSSFNQNDCFPSVAGCGGIFTIGGSDANSCTNEATVSVSVYNQPTLNVSSTSSLLCIGQNATLSVGGATTYSWLPSGTGSSIIVSPSVNTTYSVTGAIAGSCTNTAVFTQSVTSCTGIHSLDQGTIELNIFPNPATDYIKIISINNNSVDIEFTDFVGKFIKRATVLSGELVNITDIPNGIYFIKLKYLNSDTYYHFKLIKD